MLLVPITEAKGRLSEIVRESDNTEVLLMKHGTPMAVVMSARRYDEMTEELEDRLAVHERDGVVMDFEKLTTELGPEEAGGDAH